MVKIQTVVNTNLRWLILTLTSYRLLLNCYPNKNKILNKSIKLAVLKTCQDSLEQYMPSQIMSDLCLFQRTMNQGSRRFGFSLFRH